MKQEKYKCERFQCPTDLLENYEVNWNLRPSGDGMAPSEDEENYPQHIVLKDYVPNTDFGNPGQLKVGDPTDPVDDLKAEDCIKKYFDWINTPKTPEDEFHEVCNRTLYNDQLNLIVEKINKIFDTDKVQCGWVNGRLVLKTDIEDTQIIEQYKTLEKILGPEIAHTALSSLLVKKLLQENLNLDQVLSEVLDAKITNRYGLSKGGKR